MASSPYPLTINGNTYGENDLIPFAYADNFPRMVSDVATVGGLAQAARLAAETARDQAQTTISNGFVSYATLAQLTANLVPGDGARGEVYNDGANNGRYRKSGATGTGSWVFIDTLTLSGVAGIARDVSGEAFALLNSRSYLAPYDGEDISGGEEWAVAFVHETTGQVIAALRQDGSWVDFAGTSDAYDTAPIAYLATYLTKSTVHTINDAGTVTRMTDGTFDAFDPEVKNNSYVKFRADRGYGMRPFRKSLDGLIDVASDAGGIDHYIIYGQSNSVPKGLAGGFTGTVTPTGARRSFRSLMFDGWVHPNFDPAWTNELQEAATDPADLDGFVHLDVSPSSWESHAFGMSDYLDGVSSRMRLFSAHGVGGRNYKQLMAGTQPFKNIIAAVKAGRDNAARVGLKYIPKAICLMHGEADAAASNADYRANLEQWQRDFSAFILQIAPLASEVPIFMTQIANWTAINLTTSIIPALQLDTHENNANIVLVCPTYMVKHNAGLVNPVGGSPDADSPGDDIHIDAYGIRLIGEKFGKALAAGTSWSPLRPTVVSAPTGGTVITVSFAGRTGLLQFNIYDATTNPNGVVDPGNRGFELSDAGAVTITGVAIINSGTQVQITTSGALPPGARLRYAYTGIANNQAGPIEGPRGCLSDSDTQAPSALLQAYRKASLGQTDTTKAAPLVNWCVVFDKAISFS